jgi:hypothetical protein
MVTVSTFTGGLLYELLTAGTYPYAWLRSHVTLMVQRRCSSEPVPIPGSSVKLPGLLNASVLEAAALDGQSIPWKVLPDVPGLSSAGLEVKARGLIAACLAANPSDRPKLSVLQESLK